MLLLLPFALAYAATLLGRLWRNLPEAFPTLPKAVTCTLLAGVAAFTVARNLAL